MFSISTFKIDSPADQAISNLAGQHPGLSVITSINNKLICNDCSHFAEGKLQTTGEEK